MMFILDTNVVSELRKARTGKIDANVAAWAENVDAAVLFVSSITIMELELGVLSLSAGTQSREQYFAPGWSNMYCLSFQREPCLSTLLWHSAAPGYMSRISVANVMHLSLRQRLYMALLS